MYPTFPSSQCVHDLAERTKTLIQDYHTEMGQYQVLKHESKAMSDKARTLRARSKEIIECSRRLYENYLRLKENSAYVLVHDQISLKDLEKVGDG